jgi:acyl carrier protein
MTTDTSRAAIRADLEACVREVGRIPTTEAGFNQEAELFEAGYLDSLGIVALTAYIEQRFGVAFAEDELFDPRFTTIAGIADIIASHDATRPGRGQE